MGLINVDKVQILASAEVRVPLMAALQEAGLIHLREVKIEQADLRFTPPDGSGHEAVLERLKRAISRLSTWDDRKALAKLLAERPLIGLNERRALLESDYLQTLEKVERLEAEEDDTRSRVRSLEREIELCLPFQTLNIPVAQILATDAVDIQLGCLPPSGLDDLEGLAQEAGLWFRFLSCDKRSVSLFLVILKEERGEVETKLHELQFRPFHPTEVVHKAANPDARFADIIENNRIEIRKLRLRLEEIGEENRSLFQEFDRLIRVYDVLRNEHEREMSRRFLAETERTVFLEGWIRAADAEQLGRRLQPFSESLEVFIGPPAEGEDPPVVLDNPAIVKPFETITKLYGIPRNNSVDPTFPLAPFFFVFVGLCVSEAGYGAVVTLLCLLYLKFGKPRGGRRLFTRLMLLLGISNIIFGTLVGGWFGFPLRKLMVLDPLQEPVKFLALALALGFVQVWYGTLLHMRSGIREKKYVEAFFVTGGWLLLLPSLVAYGLTRHPAAGICALIGAAGIVLFASPSKNPLARVFGGFYKLYGISGYLGDTLSYSRLLALGLSTSVIAMVVNTLAKTVLGVPWIGWLLAAVVFVIGHVFNMGISFLGGFVHSMRLQFVEFFNKFINPGGRPFKPFALEGKYIDFQ